MDRKAASEREEKRDEDQRERQHRKNNVRCEELPVEGPPGAEPVEVRFAVEIEVDEVGDKEDRREEEGREHRSAVLRNAAGTDKSVAEEQRDGRESVQDRVDQRERAKLGPSDVRGSVEVDEPADEGACDGADRDDGGDDCRWGAELIVLKRAGWGRTGH